MALQSIANNAFSVSSHTSSCLKFMSLHTNGSHFNAQDAFFSTPLPFSAFVCSFTPVSNISNQHLPPTPTRVLSTKTTGSFEDTDTWKLLGLGARQQESSTNTQRRRSRAEKREQRQQVPVAARNARTSNPASTTTTAMLMIEGPKFASFDFTPSSQDGEPYNINGRRIVLPPKVPNKDSDIGSDGDIDIDKKDGPELSHTASTAKSVWDCSIVLGKYLETLSNKTPGFWKDKRVLELGAGQGIVSLSAAALGAERVIMTDIDSAVPALQSGVRLNGYEAPQVHVTALDWTNRSHALQHIWNDLLRDETTPSTTTKPQLDYILASDVIWVDYLVPALVETIADLMHVSKERRDSGTHHQQHPPLQGDKQTTQQSRQPVLLLAYQFRSTRSDQLLFDSLDQFRLLRKKITLDDNGDSKDEDSVYMDPKFRKPNIAIWKVWKE